MRVTIARIAAAAGVSRQTVDRVLNRRGGVSLERERAVLAAARSLGLDRNLERRPGRLLRVAVLMQPPANPYYEALGRGFMRANRVFSDHAITAYVTHVDVRDPQLLRPLLRKVSRGYDGLVIVAPSRADLADELGWLAARFPLVALASDIPVAGRRYVGPSNLQAGRLAGDLMGRLIGPLGGRAIVVGSSQFTGHGERIAGFAAVLHERYPRCGIAAVIDSDDRGEAAAEAVGAALAREPGSAGLYNISQGNEVIARTVARVRPLGGVTFICHDLTAGTEALLRSGRIDAVIDQDPELEAQRALELVLAHYGRLDGDPLDGRTPLRVFFRESIEA
jgi:LacI family transcriptional regulator